MRRALLIAALSFGASSAWASGATGAKPGPAEGAAPRAPITLTPDQLKWSPAPPGIPAGAEVSVLTGDPGKAGPFDLMMRMPAGYKIGMHWHSKAEALTVVGGTITFSHADGSRHALGPASFMYLPSRMDHAAACTTAEPCVLELHGVGPFDIHYLDPADDPRLQRQARPAPRTR